MKKIYSIILSLSLLLTASLLSGCRCKHSELTKISDTATCESDGIITYKCKQCDKEIEKPSPAKGHDYSIFVSDSSSCEKDGEIKNKCLKCNSIKSTPKKAIGHKGVIKCSNCNKNFYNLIYANLQPKTLKDTTSSVHSTSTVKYSKTVNDLLCITWTLSYEPPLSYGSTTTFTIKSDGSWLYTINGAYTGYAPSSGMLTGELSYKSLYLYTSKDVEKESIELPVSSTNNNDMVDLLYTNLKTDFCMSLRFLENACIINGKITMQNLGFTKF